MYEKRKAKLLSDKEICKENRGLFKEFFEYEEYKLRRINGLSVLDEGAYKTVLEYCSRFRTVNKWFKNKPWKELAKEEIQKVYDDLEDGEIINAYGRPFKNRATYYNKIFKSKPFELAGKYQIAKEIINTFQKRTANDEVRFIGEEDFKKLVEVVIQPIHKFMLWLAWDVGENINSLLQLKKKDFYRQQNEDTHGVEYRVNLPFGILKRSRMPRSELTNYPETAQHADIVLRNLDNDDMVFSFEYRQSKKIFDRAVKLTGIKCKPGNQTPTWKDLRSGMACHLLKSGWHTDEINARLGHQPSSKELNKYVNFLALDRHLPKKKLYNNNLAKVQKELEEEREKRKLLSMRIDMQKDEIADLQKEVSQIMKKEKTRTIFDPAMNKLIINPEVKKVLSLLAKQIKQARQT